MVQRAISLVSGSTVTRDDNKLRASMPDGAVSMMCTVDAGLAPVLHLDDCVGGMLVSLLKNAVQHTHSGSIKIEIILKKAPTRVKFGISSGDESLVEFRVTDTGTGVPVEMRGRLFEPVSTPQCIGAPTVLLGLLGLLQGGESHMLH